MHSLTDRFSKNNIVFVCLILLLGLVAHACMLTAPFKTLDDSISIINNTDIKDFSNTGKIFRQSFFGDNHYYRPLVSLSYMIEYHFFGLQPFYYNLTNLALHLATAVAVFFLIFFILKDRAIAFFTSLLFAIHPIHWEAVANIPGRAIILSALFTMSAFLFYCLAGEKRRFIAFYGLSLIFFTCGLLSKESAAMLPILLLFYIFLIEKNIRKYPLVLPFFLIIGVYIAARRSLGIMEIYPWRSPYEHVMGFLTFLRACLTYLRLFIWPEGLHFDRSQVMFLNFRDPGLLATLLAFVAFGFAFLKSRKRLAPYCLFFIAWFCVELFPVSQIITTIGVGPGYISAAEHFLYVPSVGIFVLLAVGFRELYRLSQKVQLLSANACRIIIGSIIVSLMLVTVFQNLHARSTVTMFQRTLAHNPNNSRILYSMGLEMANRQRFVDAEHYFHRALEREPAHISSRIALGRALFDQGRFVESITVYETVGDAGQWDKLLAKNLSEAHQMAIIQFQKRIAREPGNARAYYSLGTIYSRSGRTEEAIEEYRKAVDLDPKYPNALFNLASSCEALKRNDEARHYYIRLVNLRGYDRNLKRYAYEHLGKIYEQLGDAEKAQMYLNMAEELKSGAK